MTQELRNLEIEFNPIFNDDDDDDYLDHYEISIGSAPEGYSLEVNNIGSIPNDFYHNQNLYIYAGEDEVLNSNIKTLGELIDQNPSLKQLELIDSLGDNDYNIFIHDIINISPTYELSLSMAMNKDHQIDRSTQNYLARESLRYKGSRKEFYELIFMHSTNALNLEVDIENY